MPVACAWVTVDEADRLHRPTAGLATAYGQLRAELGESAIALTARLEALRGCLARSDVPASETIALAHTTGDGWAVLAAGRATIACVVVDISGVSVPVAIALLTMSSAAERLAPAHPAATPVLQ